MEKTSYSNWRYKEPYIQNGIGTAKGSGGGEGQNWLVFYKWVRENTPDGAIFATWWDPGHAFTAMTGRPTVADGSQNHKHVHDLALMFTNDVTKNLTDTMQLMKKYDISYFYATGDLIGKYGAISFLGTGKGESYDTLTVDRSQVTQQKDGSVLIPYPFDIQSSQGRVPTVIVFNLKNNGTDASVSWNIGNNPSQKFARLYFYTPDGRLQYRESSGADAVNLSFYVFKNYGNAMLLPPHIENNLLTRLYLFDGEGLEDYFQKVNDFSGEIKVYKVKYDKVG